MAQTEYMKAWRESHKEGIKDSRHKYYESHKEEEKEGVSKWRGKNPFGRKHIERKSVLKRKYGITPEEYDALLESQGGVCAICSASPNGRRLAVDHDHETGKVRGLLCDKCNTALGLFRDDPALLGGAIKYLGGAYSG